VHHNVIDYQTVDADIRLIVFANVSTLTRMTHIARVQFIWVVLDGLLYFARYYGFV